MFQDTKKLNLSWRGWIMFKKKLQQHVWTICYILWIAAANFIWFKAFPTKTLDWRAHVAIQAAAMFIVMMLCNYAAYVSAVTGSLLLFLCGVIKAEDLVKGFSVPTVIAIGLIPAVGLALSNTRLPNLLLQRFIDMHDPSKSTQIKLLGTVASLASVLNTTAMIGMFQSVFQTYSASSKLKLEQVMMPLSMVVQCASNFALIASSSGLFCSSLMEDNDLPVLGIFPLWPPIVILVIFTILYCVNFAPLFFPDSNGSSRTTREQSSGMMETKAVLRTFLLKVQVTARTLEKVSHESVREIEDVEFCCLSRAGSQQDAEFQETKIISEPMQLLKGDLVFFRLPIKKIKALVTEFRFNIMCLDSEKCLPNSKDASFNHCWALAVVSCDSSLIGKKYTEVANHLSYWNLMGTPRRIGLELTGPKAFENNKITGGDVLLLEGHRSSLKHGSKQFLSYQEVTETEMMDIYVMQILISALGVLFIIVTVSTKTLGLLESTLLVLLLFVNTGCLTEAQLINTIKLKIIVMIAGAMAIGSALANTGVSKFIAEKILEIAQPFGDFTLLASIWVLSVLLGVVLSPIPILTMMLNVCLPITKSTGLNIHQLMLATFNGSCVQLISPASTSAQLVMEGTSYTFSDFTKFGAPVALMNGILNVVYIYYYIKI